MIERVYINEKTQTASALDVFVLGPFLILAGWRSSTLFFRIGLIVAGYYTAVSSARTFASNDRSRPLINALASLPLPE